MPFIFAAFAGFIMGAALVALVLSRRWKQQVVEAEKNLAEIASFHQQEVAQSKALKQQVAELKFKLTRAENDLKHYQQQA
ncbi:MAG: hypothetical protein WAO12_07520 [Venatoribacter sp.]